MWIYINNLDQIIWWLKIWKGHGILIYSALQELTIRRQCVANKENNSGYFGFLITPPPPPLEFNHEIFLYYYVVCIISLDHHSWPTTCALYDTKVTKHGHPCPVDTFLLYILNVCPNIQLQHKFFLIYNIATLFTASHAHGQAKMCLCCPLPE